MSCLSWTLTKLRMIGFWATVAVQLTYAVSANGQYDPEGLKAFRFERFSLPRSSGFAELQAGLPSAIESVSLFESVELGESVFAWLGALTYGDIRSRSIALGITSQSPPALYIDLNRDNRWSPEERFRGTAADQEFYWEIPIEAEFADELSQPPKMKEFQYWVRFVFAAERQQVSAQTAGVMQGQAIYRGQACLARFEDRNANGRWFDAEDRLFVDLNFDGKISPLLERLAARGLVKLRGEMTAIEADPHGTRLLLKPAPERGRLSPTLSLAAEDASIESLEADIASRNGFHVRVTRLDESVEVPPGEYYVESIEFEANLHDETFFFSFSSENPEAKPTRIGSNETIPMNLLGELKLSASVTIPRTGGVTRLMILPKLKTSTGLFITNSQAGKGAARSENRLRTTSYSESSLIGHGSTGFS